MNRARSRSSVPRCLAPSARRSTAASVIAVLIAAGLSAVAAATPAAAQRAPSASTTSRPTPASRPAATSPPTAASTPTTGRVATAYRPPIGRPVSRPFDMRRGPYGAGNRGLDYAVVPGDRIRAIGAGVVVFAGTVAGERYVTILHPDGLRSSYSYLATVEVRLGALVAGGQVIGTASGRFQLGVRRGDTYIDPAPLLGRGGPPRRARLVPAPRG